MSRNRQWRWLVIGTEISFARYFELLECTPSLWYTRIFEMTDGNCPFTDIIYKKVTNLEFLILNNDQVNLHESVYITHEYI